MEWVCSSDVADPSDTLVSLNPDVIADVISLSTEQGILCQNQTLEQGTLLGTAFVARDMMEIIKALNEDGMLRYVGKLVIGFRALFTTLIMMTRLLLRNSSWCHICGYVSR